MTKSQELNSSYKQSSQKTYQVMITEVTVAPHKAKTIKATRFPCEKKKYIYLK